MKRLKPDDSALPSMLVEVDLRPLKEVARELPARSLLRKVIEAEPNWVTKYEFVSKLGTWLALRKAERSVLHE